MGTNVFYVYECAHMDVSVCVRERKGENWNFYLYAELATKAISQ